MKSREKKLDKALKDFGDAVLKELNKLRNPMYDLFKKRIKQ